MITPGERALRRVALALMAAILLTLACLTVLYGGHLTSPALRQPSGYAYEAVLVGAAALCGLRAVAIGRERAAWTLMALALASWAAGELIWDYAYGSGTPPIPSVSDGFWLLFYPLAAAALVALGRGRLRGLPATVWLDAITAALGVSAVSAAVIFDTVLRSTHGDFGVVATGLAYPLGDLVLLSIIVLLGVASGRRVYTPSWAMIAAGLLIFYAADSFYLVQTAEGTYRQYGLLDIGWPAGLVSIAVAAWLPFRPDTQADEHRSGVAMTVGFGMLGLGVLIADHFHPTNVLALMLASGCVISVAAGLVFAFRYRKTVEAANRARDEAIEASNAKSRFVATVSHELRTPLNGVLGMTDLLLDSELTAKQREYAEIVRTSSEGLLAIINDILDYSKIEAGTVDVVTADFSLRNTVSEACAMLLIGARAKGIDIEVITDPELPARLRGDARRIRQVIVNLVANAVKFTSGGAVTVRIAARAARDATRVRIEVSDTGIGIDDALLAQIFEPFTQADSSYSREYGGTGLGLTISAQLVEAMGGTIGAQSKRGEGSTFWFELTLAASDAGEGAVVVATGAAASAERVAVVDDHSPLILVVEDNPVNQAVAVALLAKCGYRADVVGDGREALAAVATTSYAAVLMDGQMPVMDGYEATRAIRRREVGGERLPIVAMTANSMADDEDKCRAAGMDGYLSKPVREQALREALARALGAGLEPRQLIDV